MSIVIPLVPRAKIDAEKKICDFINRARIELVAFGASLDFDAPEWDVTEYYSRQGHRNSKHGRFTIHFTQRKKDGAVPFCPQLSGFAKAYVRSELYSRNSTAFTRAIAAFRALDSAIKELEIRYLSDCDASVFNKASEVIKAGPNSLDDSGSGAALGAIARFLDAQGFVYYPLHDWKYIKKRKTLNTRVGPEFEKRKHKYLPSDEALSALPVAFHRAVEDRDILITSLIAILCSAPERINEVLVLAEKCEVEQVGGDDRRYLGLRWAGSKGASDHIKWILPGMADVVRDALTRIRSVTCSSREVAQWYELNPKKIFLPAALEYLRGKEVLALDEVGRILNLAPGKRSARKWIERAKIPYVQVLRATSSSGRSKIQAVLFSDLEKYIVGTLPPGFPMYDDVRQLKYSDALLLVPFGVFRGEGSHCMFEVVKYHHIRFSLGQNKSGGSKTVFQRVGIDPEATISIKSHQFRHWLNTLAQGANLSQIDIAKWSGRASVQQNKAYDHVSSEEIVAQIRNALGDHAKAIGSVAEIPKNLPVTRAEFAAMSIPTAHVTLYGFCIHDFTAMPCEMFRKCLDCREHICIKGLIGKAERVQGALDIASKSLVKARQAVIDQVYGAEDWVLAHEATVERLEQLTKILIDPEIADGAIIQLAASDTYSISDGAVRDRISLQRKATQLSESEELRPPSRNLKT